jgi:GH43 family beta-xylosidase
MAAPSAAILALTALTGAAPQAASASTTFTNPIAHSSDPWIIRDGGHYYIYYAADDGKDANHRIFVLTATGSDPAGSYVEANTGYPSGELYEQSGLWAIDPNVFSAGGRLYATWSGWPTSSGGRQNLYITPMSDPLHLSGPRVQISAPSRPWETVGFPVDEGPVGFQHGGKTFITYSASFCGSSSYAVGLLTNTNGNLLDPGSWVKTGPIFKYHSGVNAYLLHRIGFSAQVPAHRAAERDAAAIVTWRMRTWPRVKG